MGYREQRCSSCYYYDDHRDETDMGVCRVKPPSPLPSISSGGEHPEDRANGIWPQVSATSWCSCWIDKNIPPKGGFPNLGAWLSAASAGAAGSHGPLLTQYISQLLGISAELSDEGVASARFRLARKRGYRVFSEDAQGNLTTLIDFSAANAIQPTSNAVSWDEFDAAFSHSITNREKVFCQTWDGNVALIFHPGDQLAGMAPVPPPLEG
jgi:hypothetical protein